MHLTNRSSTAYLLATALTAPERRRPLALALATAGIIAVDSTRVLAHEHWPSDVLAGDALGMRCVPAARLG